MQAYSGDYKEMMTAVAAVILTMYHIARTLGGLFQLSVFRTWCAHALDCIATVSGKLTWAQEELDSKLKVSNEIVDNEFTDRDVSVKFDFA